MELVATLDYLGVSYDHQRLLEEDVDPSYTAFLQAVREKVFKMRKEENKNG